MILINNHIYYVYLSNVPSMIFDYFLNMNNKLLILILLFAATVQAFGFTTYNYPSITNSARSYNYRPTYNPYGQYYNPYYNNNYRNNYRNNFFGKNNSDTVKRINKIRLRNRIRNNVNSLINGNRYYGYGNGGMKVYNGEYYPNNSKGSLTGYSTPINSSALNLIPSNINNGLTNTINNNSYSPTNNMKLYQNPTSGQEFYYNDGRFYKDLRGLDSSSGVKIIYD